MIIGRPSGGTFVAAAAAGGVVGAGPGGKNIEGELSLPIILAERVHKAVAEAEPFKLECAEVGKLVDQLATKLRFAVRRATASPSVYDRPLRCIVAEAANTLERALSLIRRCKRAGVFRRVVTITTGSVDFRKIIGLLHASIGDLHWLLSVYPDENAGEGIFLGIPPIASNDPILSWVWSHIATVQLGSLASDRVEAAHALALLAQDNNRIKKIIIEEGGVPPLLFLLRDGPSVDAQIAASAALSILATNPDHVSLIIIELAVPIIVHVLSDSPMRLQTSVASLISRMAYHLPNFAQQEFALENAVHPLVSLLSFEVPLHEPGPSTSIHSLVQGMANIQYRNSTVTATSGSGGSGSSRGKSFRDYYNHNRHNRKERERESETPEVKQALKIACAEALWKLSSGSVSNSRKITDTKGLLCLSKLIEREKGELQHNCLMTVMEIAVAAESDADLRRSAFKTKYPAAKSVVDQLLKVAQQGSSPALEIAAIKAIGSLARAFSASETRVLQPLVLQLGHGNPDVAAEAATALGKFSCPENYNNVHNSKAIIEFAGVPPLMRLLSTGEKTQLPGLILLCYLVLHAAGSDALERVKALGALESFARTAIAQHPSIKDLLPMAIYHLELYRVGAHML